MSRHESANKVALAGISANFLLVIIKLFVGYQSMSQAMIADGLNSAGDVFSSFITYIEIKFPQNLEIHHPYGHGKAEYIFSIIISFALVLVAIGIFRTSINSIMNHQEIIFSYSLIVVSIITIVLKIVLYIYCNKIGRQYDNLLVIANAEDHRNDIFITSSVLLGILLSRFGIYWFDGIVGLCIAVWILYTAVQIFMSAYDVLMDKTIDEEIEKHLIEEIEKFKGVLHVDTMTAKPVGFHYLLIVKISMDGNMTVFESHDIATEIKYTLKSMTDIEDVIVHINPH